MKVNKNYSLLALAAVMLVGSEIIGYLLLVYAEPFFDKFCNSDPWPELLVIPYAILWIYSKIFWAASLVLGFIYLKYGAVLAGVGWFVLWSKRREIDISSVQKMVTFQSRTLWKSYNEERGFGRVQYEAFLNAVHIANIAMIKSWAIEQWILDGAVQSGKFTEIKPMWNRFEIDYDAEDFPYATFRGTRCKVH